MFRLIISLTVVLFLMSCNSAGKQDAVASKNNTPVVKDHSYSNVEEINTIHLHLDVVIDFE